MDDEDIRHVQQILNQNPDVGDVVPGTGGLRKLRIAASGRGKRGGSRLVYLYVRVRFRVYLMAVFSKTDYTDISPAGYRALRNLAVQLRREQ